jgi:hypothetical protein
MGQRHYNKHLARIIKKAGGELPMVKVQEDLPSAEAFEMEIALIKAIGRGKNGPLVNLTDGGDGLRPGYKHDPKVAKKIRETTKAPEFVEKARQRALGNKNNLGRKFSDDARAAMSNSHKGFKPSPESIEKRRAANTGKKRSEDFCQRSRARVDSPETRLKKSQSRLRYFERMRAQANA